MYLIAIISSCLIILTILSICAKQINELRASILSYGKLDSTPQAKPNTTWATLISKLKVPKYYFSHFYVLGLISALEFITELTLWTNFQQRGIVIYFLQQIDNSTGSRHLGRDECVIGLGMMTFHLARRVYESFWVEKPSKTAVMHVFHYLIGIGFYGAMTLGVWLEGAAQFNIWEESSDRQHLNLFTTLLAILLFLYASYHQYQCHSILASLKEKNQEGYIIPRGDWFEWLVAPHYFADILVYLSLNILYGFKNYIIIFGLIWTISNLSVVANETATWYHTYFTTEKYQQAFPNGRWRIIPYLY